MNDTQRGSITLKLILLLILVSLLPLLAVSYYSLAEGTRSLEEQEQANLRLLAISTAGRLDQLMQDTERTIRILAGDREVVAYLAASPLQRTAYQESVQQSLFTMRDSVPDFAQLYLMDRQGLFVAATNDKVIGKNFQHRDYFQRALAGEFYRSELIFGSTSGEAGIYFSGPVKDPQGGMVGVAVLKLKAEALFRLLEAMSDNDGRRTFLVDQDHIVLHHSDADWRLHSLVPLAPEQAKAILTKNGYPVQSLANLELPALDSALHNRQPGNLHLNGRSHGGALVAGFAPMESKQWQVVVTEPEAVFARPLNRLFIQSISGAAIITLLGALLSVVAGKVAVRPVAHLIRAANFMQRGDYANEQTPFSTQLLQLQGINQKRDELGQLARVFEGMAAQVYRRHEELEGLVQERTAQLEAQNERLEQAQQRIARELQVARALQLSILPTQFPTQRLFDLHASMSPAREIGGDFYDFFALDERRMGLVIADVSGKGVPAAFFMAVARTLLQGIALSGATPGQVLAETNQRLCQNNPLELFVTLLYGILDSESGRFRYANGGHPQPLLLRRDATVELLPLTGGTALGILEGLAYREQEIQLSAGDVLLLHTDGVSEAFNQQQQAFGDARLVETLRPYWNQPAQQVVQTLTDAVAEFTIGTDPSDDLTCLAVHYRGPAA